MVFKLKVVDAPAVLFKIFYFLTKANGLLPLTIVFDPLTASSSSIDVFYSTLYFLIIIVCLPYCQSVIIDFVGILKNTKETIIFVFLTQVTCSALRLWTIFLSQIFNHNNLSSFINRSVRIGGRFKRTNRQQTFLDAKLSKWCVSKFISTILQVVFMLVPAAGFVSKMSESPEIFPYLLLSFVVVLYSHMVLILSTGIYFSGMIVIGQFYRNLNDRIRKLTRKISISNCNGKSIHMQEFCNLSDESDELTALYRDITNHAANFNKYQQCFTIFGLSQYFVLLLAEIFDMYTQIIRDINANNAAIPQSSTTNQLLKEFGFISFYVIELYYTIAVTSFVLNEARKTSALLKLCNRPNYDIRLRRSMETLSLQILAHSPKATVCGLFEINNELLFGMGATFASYLIILVQFVEDD